MNNEVRYLMSEKQLNRFSVISKTIDGHMTIAEAAVSLGISERQILRLKQGVSAEGAAFLIHKNTGRKPQHAMDDKLITNIITLKQSENYIYLLISNTFKSCLRLMKKLRLVILLFILY